MERGSQGGWQHWVGGEFHSNSNYQLVDWSCGARWGQHCCIQRYSGSRDWRAPRVRWLRGSMFGFLDHMKGMQSACDVCGGFWGLFSHIYGFRGIVDENLAIIYLPSYPGSSLPYSNAGSWPVGCQAPETSFMFEWLLKLNFWLTFHLRNGLSTFLMQLTHKIWWSPF